MRGHRARIILCGCFHSGVDHSSNISVRSEDWTTIMSQSLNLSGQAIMTTAIGSRLRAHRVPLITNRVYEEKSSNRHRDTRRPPSERHMKFTKSHRE